MLLQGKCSDLQMVGLFWEVPENLGEAQSEEEGHWGQVSGLILFLSLITTMK